MKNIGITLIIIGIIMVAYSGFDYATRKKIADIGSVEITKNENHHVEWSPIVGVVLLMGGIAITAASKKPSG